MADNKDQEKNKKRTSRATKISFVRCLICGGRKYETDMMTMANEFRSCRRGPSGICEECANKQRKKSDGGAMSGYKSVHQKK